MLSLSEKLVKNQERLLSLVRAGQVVLDNRSFPPLRVVAGQTSLADYPVLVGMLCSKKIKINKATGEVIELPRPEHAP